MRIVNRKKFFRFLIVVLLLIAVIPVSREVRTSWTYRQSTDQTMLQKALNDLGEEDGLFEVEARELRGPTGQVLLSMTGARQEGQLALKGELPWIEAPFAFVYTEDQWHRQDPLNGTWWKLTPGEVEGQKDFIDPLIPWLWLPDSLDQGIYTETIREGARRLRIYQGKEGETFSWLGSQWRILSSEIVLHRQTGQLVRLNFWAADAQEEDKTLEWSIRCFPLEKKTWQKLGF